jgi:hypothetical protein
MRKTPVFFIFACCLVGVAAHAQSKQKPGLWEMTSTMNMAGMPQMPQMPQGAQMPNVQLPPGVTLPPGVQMPQAGAMPGGMGGPMGGAHTTQVCVTQAMIDKYGGPYSNPSRGDCKVTNVSIKDTGMTASIACTGQMTGTGTVVTTFTDPSSSQTKVHITGTMQMGPNSRPLDVTMQSNAVYKGADCGSVKPIVIPDSK